MILISKDYYLIKRFPKKGLGVVAVKEIPADTVLGDYLGKIIKITEEDAYEKKFGNYIMFYNDRASIFPVDLKAVGVHLFNHSCSANCAIMPFQKHMLFVASRKIFPSEELTISYSIEPPSLTERFQYPCFCESPLCHGAMYISGKKSQRIYQFLRKKQGENFNKLEVPFGQTLKPLKKYPRLLVDSFGHDIFASLAEPPVFIPGKKLPETKTLRQRIKNTGRCLYFPETRYCLWAVVDGMLISAPEVFLKEFVI